MKKYQIEHAIGSGNFSTVFKAVLLPQHSSCAIKIMKSHHTIALRQAQMLSKLKHPNIVSIIDFEQTQNESRMILQYVGINTLQLYESQEHGLKQEQVKCILFQAALGLSCVHSQGIIHRDIKPQNIIIDKKVAVVKLIDFGLAVEQSKCSTDYIATRWYRSPQNLLGTKEYSCAIDIFSLGCVIVQLYLGSPLFPGSNNVDQIYKIFNILGYPTQTSWPKGFQKLQTLGIKCQRKCDIDLRTIMNNCDPKLVQIVQKMLELNPSKRIKCAQILKNDYFRDIKAIIPPFVFHKYEHDILGFNRSLSFKSVYAVKSCKNILHPESKFFKKLSRLNIASLKSKPKQADFPKHIESPQFLKQKKSSSLNSGKTKQENECIANIKSKQKLNTMDSLKRKTSTPSLFSNNTKFIPTNKNSYHVIRDCEKRTKQKSKSHKQIKTFPNGTIQEKNQLKQSQLAPDSQATTISHISKTYTPKAQQEAQIKNLSGFNQTQIARNKFYPVIPNVHLAVQHLDQSNSSIVQRRVTSPQIPKIFQLQHSQEARKFQQSHNISHIISKKKDLGHQNFKVISKTLGLQEYTYITNQNYNNSTKAIEIKPNQELCQKGVYIAQVQSKPLITKYVLPNNKFGSIENMKNKIQYNFKTDHHPKQVAQKPIVSPSHRFFAMSPENRQFLQKKMQPTFQLSHQHLSPFHRKL